MPVNRLRKFASIAEVETFLNGGIIIGLGKLGGGVPGLIGQTLKFTQPSATTVTFAAPPATPVRDDPTLLRFADIKSQIELALTGLNVSSVDDKLLIREKVPTNGVKLDPTGTASSQFGFGSADGGLVYGPPQGTLTAPCWTGMFTDNNGMYCILVWE